MQRPDMEDWKKIKRRIIEAGGVEYSKKAAEKLVGDSVAILKKFPPSKNRSILEEIAMFITDRDF